MQCVPARVALVTRIKSTQLLVISASRAAAAAAVVVAVASISFVRVNLDEISGKDILYMMD